MDRGFEEESTSGRVGSIVKACRQCDGTRCRCIYGIVEAAHQWYSE